MNWKSLYNEKERVRKRMFRGFPEETVRFFLDIRLHNDISYFKAHEEEFRQFVKEPFFSFIEAMGPTVRKISEDMELRPAKCLARLRRDTRFTKDKSPFRDHLWLLFRRSGEAKELGAMYWFEFSPDSVEWGLGFWGDNRPAMDALRRRMVVRPSEFLGALKACDIPDPSIQLFGDMYQRMKLPEELPEALKTYYPRKSIYFKRADAPFGLAYKQELIQEVSKDMLRLKPMYEVLRSVADEGMAQLDA